MQINIKTEISEMDYNKIISLIKMHIKPDNIIHAAAFKIIDTQQAEKVIFNLMEIKFVKSIVMKKLNDYFVRMNYTFWLDDFTLTCSGALTLLDIRLTIEDLSYVTNLVQKHVKTKNEEINAVIFSAVNSFVNIIPDPLKLDLISQIFCDSEEEICSLISNFISEKFFTLKLHSISLTGSSEVEI